MRDTLKRRGVASRAPQRPCRIRISGVIGKRRKRLKAVGIAQLFHVYFAAGNDRIVKYRAAHTGIAQAQNARCGEQISRIRLALKQRNDLAYTGRTCSRAHIGKASAVEQ